MRIDVLLGVVLIVAGGLAAPALGKGGRPVGPRAGAWLEKQGPMSAAEQLKTMDVLLSLSAEQRLEIRSRLETRTSDMAAWGAVNAGRLADLHGEIKRARSRGDREGVILARRAVEPLREAREEIVDSAEVLILAALTPEQQTQWQGYELSQPILRLGKKLALTDEQTAQIRALGRDEAQRLGPQPTAREMQDAEVELREEVVESALTPEQGRVLAQMKGRKGAAVPAAPASATEPGR